MALLARIGTWLLNLLAPIIIDRIIEATRKWKAAKEAREKAEADARQSVEDLKKAKTADEIDKAAHDALNGV